MGCDIYIGAGSGLPDIGGGDMRVFGSLYMESWSVAGEDPPQPEAFECGDRDSLSVLKYLVSCPAPGTVSGWVVFLFRLRVQRKKIATVAAAITARPPMTPPTMAPVPDFLAGGGVGVCGGGGVIGVVEVVLAEVVAFVLVSRILKVDISVQRT